jgi:hypothetical protein
VGAAIALIDGATVRDPELCFDLAAAWGRGKRIALLADCAERREQLPPQLQKTEIVPRVDRTALASFVEDLAFDLGLRPRIGQDAQRAIEQLSSAPPPPDPRSNGAPANGSHTAGAEVRRGFQIAPRPPAIPSEVFGNDEVTADDELELMSGEDVEPVPERELPGFISGDSCELSLEAGRAISECSFHRDEGGNFAAELGRSFGRFIDAVGGNWRELERLGDVDGWLGATDNLLASLPPNKKHISEWYELGFQFSTLHSIAEQGWPLDPEQRAAYQELWNQAMTAFLQAAESAQITTLKAQRVQVLLENLIGPEPQRDYTNVARSLHELRSLAEQADRF